MFGAEEVWEFAPATFVGLRRGKVIRIQSEEVKAPLPSRVASRATPTLETEPESSPYAKSATDLRKQWGWESQGRLDRPAERQGNAR